MKRNLLFSAFIACVASLTTVLIYNFADTDKKIVKIEHLSSDVGVPVSLSKAQLNSDSYLDFRVTARNAIEAVVHVKSTQLYKGNDQILEGSKIPDPFRDFFGDDFESFFGPRFRFESPDTERAPGNSPARVGTGSGVIISSDGYIITNNHVVADADDIEITLYDNRSYKAQVVGTDPSTDLAVLQIKEKDLPVIPFDNSDNLDIGQWVLAIGNPMGLNSTVTAGIISAKGRNINILKDKYAVENFIQTDAAINPGNSGGALVNLDGGLIGINTAIASPTGVYSGYGFAIPSNIVNKVLKDIIEYGAVQRGVLGVMIRTVDSKLAAEKGFDFVQGVYVDSLLEHSAAGQAGLRKGDIVHTVEDIPVKSSAELQGIVAQHRPGEPLRLGVSREGKNVTIDVTLKNPGAELRMNKDNSELLKILGAEFEDLKKDEGKGWELNQVFV